MKKFLSVIMGVFLLFIISSCGAKKPIEYKKIDYEIVEKGVLKTTIKTSFSSDEFSMRKDTFTNENGIVSFEYIYFYNKKSKDWEVYNKISNRYNSNNLLTLKVEENQRYDSSIITTYSYNSNNLLVSEIETKEDEQTISTYDYDSNNNLICEITDGPRDYYKCEYTYDESNNLISEHYYTSGNGGYSWAYQSIDRFTYENKNLIKEEHLYLYNDNWKISSLEENKYDESNKLIETIFYEALDDGTKYKEETKTKYKYDEKNNLVKEVEYNRGNKYWSLQKWNECYKTKYKYDEKNNMISKEEYDVSIWETKAYRKTNYYYTYYD